LFCTIEGPLVSIARANLFRKCFTSGCDNDDLPRDSRLDTDLDPKLQINLTPSSHIDSSSRRAKLHPSSIVQYPSATNPIDSGTWRKTRDHSYNKCASACPCQTNSLTPKQADKQASSASSGFSFFGGRGDKYEAAADLYTQAANSFRLQKQFKEAGLAFERAANIQTNQLKEPDDAANTLTEAFKAYRTTDPEDAARCLGQAIQHYTLKGNFRRAATNQEKLGELYEVQLGDSKRALDAYDTAANWYENDNAEALANKWWIKVAELAAEEEQYPRAVECFEKVGAMRRNQMNFKHEVLIRDRSPNQQSITTS